jgi:hypothetical protein
MTYLWREAPAKYGIVVNGVSAVRSGPILAPVLTPSPSPPRKRVTGRSYIDASGNYVIPADIVPFVGVSTDGTFRPSYHGMKS